MRFVRFLGTALLDLNLTKLGYSNIGAGQKMSSKLNKPRPLWQYLLWSFKLWDKKIGRFFYPKKE